MKGTKIVSALIVVCSLLFVGAFIFIYDFAKENHSNLTSVTVNDSGILEETITVKGLELYPSQSIEHEIKIKTEVSGDYDITLEYDEKTNGGLKNHVTVTVMVGGEELFYSSLQDLLDNDKKIKFIDTLNRKSPLKITILYSMPAEVGNEAQGSYADFDVTLKIKKRYVEVVQ